MSDNYKMDVLRTIVNEKFNVEITKRTNKRDAVTARKIFSKILIDKGYTRSEVGKYLKKDHSSIVYYMNDVHWLIKYSPEIEEMYLQCKEDFSNVTGSTKDEERKSVVSLKVRIDELLLEREQLEQKINRYERIKKIIELVDVRTPIGKEYFIYKKINLMYNGLIDYGGQLE